MDRGPLILVAERDPFAAEFTEHFLRTEGHRVETVFSAEDALVAAERSKPDLVVVDMLVSDANGQRLCSQLLEDGSAPVVAVCSLTPPEVAMSIGAADFLRKPVEPLELVAAIHKLVTRTSNPEAE